MTSLECLSLENNKLEGEVPTELMHWYGRYRGGAVVRSRWCGGAVVRWCGGAVVRCQYTDTILQYRYGAQRSHCGISQCGVVTPYNAAMW